MNFKICKERGIIYYIFTGDPRQRMPPNREVELISKWRDVDTADMELQETRQNYANKMKEFEERWRKLEAGQLEVKQNLIKFNNFVREKQVDN